MARHRIKMAQSVEFLQNVLIFLALRGSVVNDDGIVP
jgi:hypothetical protein